MLIHSNYLFKALGCTIILFVICSCSLTQQRGVEFSKFLDDDCLQLHSLVNDSYPYVPHYSRTINGVVYPYNDHDTDFLDHEGRLTLLKNYISQTGDINIHDEYGMTAAAHAAAIGDLNYIKYLHQAGVQPITCSISQYKRDGIRSTNPIVWTIYKNQLEAMYLLLELGYSPVGADECIVYDRVSMLCKLVQHGADVRDGAFGKDLPPTIWFAKSPEMVSFLQKQGCSLNAAKAYAKTQPFQKESKFSEWGVRE